MNIPEVESNVMSTAAHAGISQAGNVFSLSEIAMTGVIFVFGLVATGMFYLLVRKQRMTPFIMRIYVIIILVFGTLLVVSSAYAADQIAPVVGFFGTIAGYLLGRSDRHESSEGDDKMTAAPSDNGQPGSGNSDLRLDAD